MQKLLPLRFRIRLLWLCLALFGAQLGVQQLHQLKHSQMPDPVYRVSSTQISASKSAQYAQDDEDDDDCALCWSIAGLSQALPLASFVLFLAALLFSLRKAGPSFQPTSSTRLALSLRGPPRFAF